MNVQDQKLESRIAELQEQLAAANQRVAEMTKNLEYLRSGGMSVAVLTQRAEAAERELATARLNMASALDHIESLINELRLHGIDADSNDEAIAAKLFFDQTLAQIEQPQGTPTNHISAHPPTPSDEVQELRGLAADWQKQFHQLESLCKERGLTVGYGDHGHVTLSEEPKQQRPGEDPPFDACRCPACLTIRAKLRSSNEL